MLLNQTQPKVSQEMESSQPEQVEEQMAQDRHGPDAYHCCTRQCQSLCRSCPQWRARGAFSAQFQWTSSLGLCREKVFWRQRPLTRARRRRKIEVFFWITILNLSISDFRLDAVTGAAGGQGSISRAEFCPVWDPPSGLKPPRRGGETGGEAC